MPPTAIGRTMKLHTAPAWSAQNELLGLMTLAPAGANCATSVGPPRNRISGTSRPQATTPPAKFSDASRGPMMYPTPRYAGLIAGADHVVAAPAASFGAVELRPMRTKLLPNWPTFTMKSRLGVNRLNCPSRYTSPPKPILENRILAARLPCWPAL